MHWGAIAAVGFLTLISPGALFCWGNFTTYVTSWLRSFNPTLTVEKTFVVYAVALSVCVFSIPLGGSLENKFGTRVVMIAGSLFMIGSLFLTTLVRSLLVLCLTYGVVFGFGAGLIFACPVSCGVSWQPQKKGLITGLIMAGLGAGPVLLNFIATAYVNPDNLTPTIEFEGRKYFGEEVYSRVPGMFMVLAAVMSVLLAVGCVFLKRKPADITDDKSVTQPLLADASSSVINSSSNAASYTSSPGSPSVVPPFNPPALTASLLSQAGSQQTLYASRMSLSKEGRDGVLRDPRDSLSSFSSTGSVKKVRFLSNDGKIETNEDFQEPSKEIAPLQALKTPQFWATWILLLTLSMPGTFTSAIYKSLASGVIDDDLFLSQIGSFSAVGNALGRVLWGGLVDKLGYKRAVFWIAILDTLLLLAYPGSLRVHPLLFALVTCLLMSLYGGSIPVLVAGICENFGSANVGTIFGMLETAEGLGVFFEAFALDSLSSKLGDRGIVFLLAGLCAAGAALGFFQLFPYLLCGGARKEGAGEGNSLKKKNRRRRKVSSEETDYIPPTSGSEYTYVALSKEGEV